MSPIKKQISDSNKNTDKNIKSEINNMPCERVKIGDSASMKRVFSAEVIDSYTELSMDSNPIHTDDTVAEKSILKKRVSHGMLVASLISAVLGTRLPGPGSIYKSQELKFRAPVFIGDTIEATVTVIDYDEDNNVCVLSTVCRNQDNVVVIDGMAELLVLPR